ncbi:MAG: NAD(P)/FAD-dependent oxidoreductase [Ruminococcus sp.]|jgi:predicted Rossmann fold flavoprotein|nr:NAD(P)/FAD-dependent oxidoreductase [Ruminococcus sp.]
MNLLIIGTGAAGLFAAVTAARNNLSVTVLDKNRTPGKKLRITGKGRCNVTNNCTKEEFFDSITNNAKFLFSAYSNFTAQDTMRFFEDLGVPLKTERGNRVFPESDSAHDIADALVNECKRLGVTFREFNVKKILHDNGRVTGVTDGNNEIYAENIILATGGKSYPGTGSDGSGYKLAADLGVNITDIRPSLVPLVVREKFVKDLQGLSLRNVKLSITENNKVVFSEQGEMLFTDYGITGPLVLSASAHIKNPLGAIAGIDLKLALDELTLDRRILRDFDENPNRHFGNALDKLLPSSLRPIIVNLSGINPEKQVNAVTKAERSALVKLLKNFSLEITGFRPILEAIITRGGVNIKEIEPKTMRHKKIPNLYFAGEVIDLDAYTGGYNLQIAFTTAFAAAKAATDSY